VACIALSSFAAAAEGPWSRFRGPNGSGISDAPSMPVRWTADDYRWKVKVPGGHSSPIVWEDRIYLTAADPASAARSVLCLDAADGRTLWKRDYPSKTYPQHGDNHYASSTPTADADGVVVTWTTPEEVLVLALAPDGRELWRRGLGPFVGDRGSATSPILVDDMVVLANDQEDRNLLPEFQGKAPPGPVGKSFAIALDRKTGATRWQTPRRTGLTAYSTPCLYRPADGPPQLLFTSTLQGISAVEAATGKPLWEMPELFRDRCVGSPVVAPGLVLAGYGSGLRGTRFVAVRPGTETRKPEIAYELTQALPLVPTPIVRGDRLFLWTDDGIVSCLNVTNGKVLWRERVGGAYYASPLWIAGRLYGISKAGEVVVLAAADQYEVLGRVPLGEPVFATPAVAGGAMVLRTHSHLYRLDGGKEQP
jgi:outer membrane protein assembly factor BamB